jgi:flagella basal body P-ring formation protein FlgA
MNLPQRLVDAGQVEPVDHLCARNVQCLSRARRIGDVESRNVRTCCCVSTLEHGNVADPPRPGLALHVSREQVVHRLNLAGIDQSLWQVHGAKSVSVAMPTIEDYNVQLAAPRRAPIRVAGSRENIRLEARVRAARSLIGRVQVIVAVLTNEKSQQEIPVNFDVQFVQTIAVAKQRIDRGQTITSDSVTLERRPVDAADALPAPTSLVGSKAKRTILPTQIIASADLELAAEDNPVLVKQRDVVKMRVQAGGLHVSAAGEALQDGRAGQMIRVRNVDSQSIVLGRVIDRSVVEIRY